MPDVSFGRTMEPLEPRIAPESFLIAGWQMIRPVCRDATMELKFECPMCGQHISATPAQIGVTAPCPHCGAAVTVPARQGDDQAVFVLPTKLPFLKSHRKKILEAKVSELVSLGPIDESIEAKL